MTRIGQLAEYVAGDVALPDEVVSRAKACILDQLGVTLGGLVLPASAAARATVREAFGRGPCTVLGERERFSVVASAFSNGVSGSALDLDEGHNLAVGHPASVVFPAALAVAEAAGASGLKLVEGFVKGYEVAARVSSGRVSPRTYATGPWGAYGAAAAAAAVMKMRPDRALHALAVAGCHAPARPPVRGYQAVPSIKEAIGWASATGAAAAFSARAGLTGIEDILEGPDYHDGVVQGLGETFFITGNYFKLHAACRWTHAAIDGALSLRQEIAEARDAIRWIKVRTFSRAVQLSSPRPRTPEEAQYSLPWVVAVALIDGAVGPRQIAPPALDRADVLDLARKVTLEVDPIADAEFPKARRASVEICVSGKTLSVQVPEPKGSPGSPLSREELERKFRDHAGEVLEDAAVEEVLRMVGRLEEMPRVSTLTSRIRSELRT